MCNIPIPFAAYMAPEVFMKTNQEGHGRAVDVWSLGCVLVEMGSGKVGEDDICFLYLFNDNLVYFWISLIIYKKKVITF